MAASGQKQTSGRLEQATCFVVSVLLHTGGRGSGPTWAKLPLRLDIPSRRRVAFPTASLASGRHEAARNHTGRLYGKRV